MRKLSITALLIVDMIYKSDCSRTFDGDLLLSRSRMREEIHLDAHLAHRTLVRTSGIWNFKSSQLELTPKREMVVKLEWHLDTTRTSSDSI